MLHFARQPFETRHGGQRPAIHDFLTAYCEVLDGASSHIITREVQCVPRLFCLIRLGPLAALVRDFAMMFLARLWLYEEEEDGAEYEYPQYQPCEALVRRMPPPILLAFPP